MDDYIRERFDRIVTLFHSQGIYEPSDIQHFIGLSDQLTCRDEISHLDVYGNACSLAADYIFETCVGYEISDKSEAIRAFDDWLPNATLSSNDGNHRVVALRK